MTGNEFKFRFKLDLTLSCGIRLMSINENNKPSYKHLNIWWMFNNLESKITIGRDFIEFQTRGHFTRYEYWDSALQFTKLFNISTMSFKNCVDIDNLDNCMYGWEPIVRGYSEIGHSVDDTNILGLK